MITRSWYEVNFLLYFYHQCRILPRLVSIYICCCSVTQLCPTLCNPMDCSMSGLSDPHHLPRFAQVHAHCIGDTIQTSHRLDTLFSSCPQSFLASGALPMSLVFMLDDQNTGVSYTFSILECVYLSIYIHIHIYYLKYINETYIYIINLYFFIL